MHVQLTLLPIFDFPLLSKIFEGQGYFAAPKAYLCLMSLVQEARKQQEQPKPPFPQDILLLLKIHSTLEWFLNGDLHLS